MTPALPVELIAMSTPTIVQPSIHVFLSTEVGFASLFVTSVFVILEAVDQKAKTLLKSFIECSMHVGYCVHRLDARLYIDVIEKEYLVEFFFWLSNIVTAGVHFLSEQDGHYNNNNSAE